MGETAGAKLKLYNDTNFYRMRYYIHFSLDIIYMLAELFVSSFTHIVLFLYICP